MQRKHCFSKTVAACALSKEPSSRSDQVTLCAGLKAGYFGLFAKYGQPPGWRYGEWDFRPEWDYFSERNKDIEVKFDASQPAWQLGVRRHSSSTDIKRLFLCQMYQSICASFK